MSEIWKKIDGFGKYEVSNQGRIKRIAHIRYDKRGRIAMIKEIIMKPETVHNGYLRVGLYRNGKLYHKRVASLVAEAFLGQRPPDMEIDHIDGNKTNNTVENLRYATHKDNVNNPVTVKKRRAYWKIYWQKKNPTCYLR